MSVLQYVALTLAVVGIALGITALLLVRAARREQARIARLRAAQLKAMKLVVDFEHTPVRGASRDRSMRGKARRQARRS